MMRRSTLFPKFSLVILTLAFTGFTFLNTYEVVFNQDIAFANSLRNFEAQHQLRTITEQFDLKPEAGRENSNAPYNKLQYIQIPSLASNLYLEEERVIDGDWYQRPSLAHYIGLNKDAQGITVDYLIYTDTSWQTIPNPNQIEPGMDVKLFHDGFAMSLFRVAEKKVLPFETAFVASKSDSRQIILIIEDADKDVYYAYSLVLKD